MLAKKSIDSDYYNVGRSAVAEELTGFVEGGKDSGAPTVEDHDTGDRFELQASLKFTENDVVEVRFAAGSVSWAEKDENRDCPRVNPLGQRTQTLLDGRRR
jgi:hypothetical protein